MVGLSYHSRKTFLTKVKEIIFSPAYFPIILLSILILILFVLFRVKIVEMEYSISENYKEIEKVTALNKELKAQKAKMLSTKQLHKMAKKYNLKQAKQNQIIVIP